MVVALAIACSDPPPPPPPAAQRTTCGEVISVALPTGFTCTPNPSPIVTGASVEGPRVRIVLMASPQVVRCAAGGCGGGGSLQAVASAITTAAPADPTVRLCMRHCSGMMPVQAAPERLVRHPNESGRCGTLPVSRR